MSTALNAAGQRVFTAYATQLNAAHSVILLDKNGDPVPFSANIANNTLYHQFDQPLIFVKRPGSDSQYFLFTQVSDGVNDFLYRHTLDASLPGNGSVEEPLGETTEVNHLVNTNNNDLRYGVSVQAVQNLGGSNTTWMYFLRSSATQVQLTAKVLNANGSFGGSISVAPVNGTPIGKIKFSPDGKQLLFAYVPPAILNQVQLARVRRYGIGPNGELALLEEKSLPGNVLEFEFSPDGKFIYYGLAISETPPAVLGKRAEQPGIKFRIRRWNLASQEDELVGDSYNDEIFNGKDLALQRSSNGRMYISAAGHRRMMVINDPGSVAVPVLQGEEIADNDPDKAPYLSGAFATIAFDHHFHSVPTNGIFYSRRNKRQYESKDHLENVHVVVSDLRAADGSANVVSVNNYYPYGMIMPGRNYNSGDYRYAFNGKEKDDEIKGTGNSYDFGARLYDPRVGRWPTIDPLAEKFAGWSGYNAFLDNPILYVDPDGRAAKVIFDRNNHTITIHVTVLLKGEKADARIVRLAKQDINKFWGGNYKVRYKGEKYNIRIEADVQKVPDDFESVLSIDRLESGHNIVNIVEEGDLEDGRSNVGNWDHVRVGWDPYLAPHEFGHLLDLDDTYEDLSRGRRKTWRPRNIMSHPSGRPVKPRYWMRKFAREAIDDGRATQHIYTTVDRLDLFYNMRMIEVVEPVRRKGIKKHRDSMLKDEEMRRMELPEVDYGYDKKEG